MNKERKKFNLFNILNRDGKGVRKEDSVNYLEKPDIPNFFRFVSRHFNQMVSVNMFYIFGNFPLLFGLFALAGYTSTSTVTPGSGIYSAFSGSLMLSAGSADAAASPVIASLNGIYGKHILSSVPTTFTYVMYALTLLVFITFGLVNVGCSYIIRNIMKGDHVFMWSDFWYAVRRNIKQGIIFGIMDLFICLMLFYDLLWFRANINVSTLAMAFYFLSFGMIILYFFVRMYIYLMMITFDLSLFKLLKNGVFFMVLGIKRNLMCFLGTVIAVVFNIALFWFFMPVGIILPFIITPAFCSFLSVYCAFPKIKEIMIDPYYKEVKEPAEG